MLFDEIDGCNHNELEHFYAIISFSDVREFHNIVHINNITSIIEHGILSFNEAKKIVHQSIAMNKIQQKRDNTKIPNGKFLHDYANLYFHARNPMMYLRQAEEICVLIINKNIYNLPDVVFSDRNASSDYVAFLDKHNLDVLNYRYIYAKDWTDSNTPEYYIKKSMKCAEILIPKRVETEYIEGAYVKNNQDREKLQKLGFVKPIMINKDIFFRI